MLCHFQDVESFSDSVNELFLLHFNFAFQKQIFQRRLHKDWVFLNVNSVEFHTHNLLV